MADLILHHFASSPFSEKVRLMLGFKQLAWKSVDVPVILPKPDVVALTGGYRRTPFLQVAADIYCDTALIAHVLEERAPAPSLFPPGPTGPHHVLAQWADSALFWTAIPYTARRTGIPHLFGDATPEFLAALQADRAAMTAGSRRATLTDATAQLVTYLGWLHTMLEGGQAFLLGDQPGLADFAVAQSLWFIRLVPPTAGVLEPYPRLLAWYERVAAFGHGRAEALSSSAAIEIAAAGGHAATQVEPGLGFEAGAAITVSATDYATDLVAGTLVGLTAREVVLERHDDRAGTVHVHFPRIGYQLKQAS